MKNVRHIGRLEKDQILKIERSVSRDMEIASGLRVCHHKVHKSAKTYTRKEKHRKFPL